MFGLTTLGIVHTLISLIALGLGFVALVRDREILPESRVGKAYIWATVLTCITSFGIFQHGGFGKPHALGIITLLVLGVAALLNPPGPVKPWHRYVATVCYTLTVFFHVVPGVTESVTRLPLGRPLVASPDDPTLQNALALILLVFVAGMALQMRRLWVSRERPTPNSLA